MASKVYTKKGDKGYTSVMGNRKRFPKCDPRIDTIGTVDELNAYVGLVRASLDDYLNRTDLYPSIITRITTYDITLIKSRMIYFLSVLHWPILN